MLSTMFGRKKSRVPQWAYPLDEQRFTVFMGAVEARFARVAHEYGEGSLRTIDGYEHNLVVLAQQSASMRPADIPAFVNWHFDSLAAASQMSVPQPPPPVPVPVPVPPPRPAGASLADFASAAPYLAVRLYPESWVARTDPSHLVSEPIAGELFAMLVYDSPGGNETIDPADVTAWGKKLDELIGIGMDNVLARYPASPQPMDVGGHTCFAIEDKHYFAGNVVFGMETYAGLVGPGGSLVIMPTHGTAIVYPITDARAGEVMRLLPPLAAQIAQNGPGPLTTQMFWYHEGLIDVLPYQMDGNNVLVYPPEEFTAMIDALAPAPG